MPVKNYTTGVPADRSIAEIQQALVKRGADGIMMTYAPDGRIASLMFRMTIAGRPVSFALPVKWQKFQALLKRQGVSKWRDDAYCYRVAWRCLRDWTLAQMALFDTDMVELPQVFLPFAMVTPELTMYDQVMTGKLLGTGS